MTQWAKFTYYQRAQQLHDCVTAANHQQPDREDGQTDTVSCFVLVFEEAE